MFQTIMSLFHLLLGKEHWLGLKNIYKLTNRQNVRTKLKIILERFSGEITTILYDDFSLKDQVCKTSLSWIGNITKPKHSLIFFYFFSLLHIPENVENVSCGWGKLRYESRDFSLSRHTSLWKVRFSICHIQILHTM